MQISTDMGVNRGKKRVNTELNSKHKTEFKSAERRRGRYGAQASRVKKRVNIELKRVNTELK
jgi:hypothetical protein